MADADDDFDKAFDNFGKDPGSVTPPTEPPNPDDATPPASSPETPAKPAEEPKKDDPAKPEEPQKPEEATPPASDEKKPEEVAEPPKTPETPPTAEEPKPLTEDGVRSIIRDIQTQERSSGKEIETTTNDVLEAYYPDGLSNVLVDQSSGKELKTPQDVIDASGGNMPIEEATQWLMNEQFKLDKEVNQIKSDAQKIAENTISFKRDSVAALQKYEPLFKAYPTLQKKVFDKLMQQVKADTTKGVILAAPDVMDHYDFYLEPYQKAFEYSTKEPATNPNPPAPAPATPGASDRMDETGDGGATPPDDPNDFAQQVNKELAKEL